MNGLSLCSDCDLPFAEHPGYQDEHTIITDLMCLQALRHRVEVLEAAHAQAAPVLAAAEAWTADNPDRRAYERLFEAVATWRTVRRGEVSRE